jgi:anti-sigma factor RsiW
LNLRLRDELIMAFADGELEAPLAETVREAINADTQARSKHEMYLGTRCMLARAFNGVLDDPIPARLTGPLQQLCAKRRSRA